MDASFIAVQRLVADALPDAPPLVRGGGPLDQIAVADEEFRTAAATLLEPPFRGHRVVGEPEPRFAAFLDGTQKIQVLGYYDGVPLVLGTVAAVVRERRNRRLVTRAHRVERRVYAPRPALGVAAWARLGERCDLRDTSQDAHGGVLPSHPVALAKLAVGCIQRDREHLEGLLARDWCAAADAAPLFIDGGIGGNERVARASCAVGIVKSHRTLHAEGDDLRLVLALPRGHRSSVFRVAPARRPAVASWYLRLREPAGRDPMFGLVRVEVTDMRAASQEELAARAERVSRWVLAEAAPLALPDGRWDTMVYGVRDCEEFLRAVW
ncbi:MAG TPA: hypothetical protein VNA89_06910 [Gemmatimonadaceae bacterium]|nr:hypothetical protein [Gemmatimonadaceae bacterium]